MKKLTCRLMLCVALLGLPAMGQEYTEEELGSNIGLGLKVGTLGFGADLVVGLSPSFNMRFNGNYFSYREASGESTADKTNYEIDMMTGMILVDWYPVDSRLRFTAGISFNDSEYRQEEVSQDTLDVGDNDYPASGVGTLTHLVSMQPVAPYIGVGSGDALEPGRSWTFQFDLGFIIQLYDVNVSASGPLNSDPEFQKDLKAEQAEWDDNADSLPVYPVIAIGAAYHF